MFKCPIDSAVLVDSSRASVCVFVQDDYDFHECPYCRGIWIPQHVLERMLSDHALRNVSTLSGFQKRQDDERTFDIRGHVKGNLCCPSDGERLFIIKHKGIELDLCGDCGGMWLDRGELDKLKSLSDGKGSGSEGSDYNLVDLLFDLFFFL